MHGVLTCVEEDIIFLASSQCLSTDFVNTGNQLIDERRRADRKREIELLHQRELQAVVTVPSSTTSGRRSNAKKVHDMDIQTWTMPVEQRRVFLHQGQLRAAHAGEYSCQCSAKK